MPTVSTRLGSASDWCASDHLVYRSSSCSGRRILRIIRRIQTIRLYESFLTEDFSKPIVPVRAISDRLLTRQNDHSRSRARSSSRWLERHVAGASDHHTRHARACEPPDQTWIAGIYDQADFDDVVGLLTSAVEA